MLVEFSQAKDVSVGKLDTNVISLPELKTNTEVKLKIHEGSSLSTISTSLDTVTTVYDEINKEKKVMRVESELQNKYLTEQRKLSAKESNFNSGVKKTLEYKSSSQAKLRAKRALGSRSQATAKSPLLRGERESLQLFFESFHRLNKEKKSLFNSLMRASGENFSGENTNQDFIDVSRITKALGEINWSKEKLRLQKEIPDPPGRKPRKSPEQPDRSNLYGWGNWENSPWKPFFESEGKWLELMEKLKNSQKDLDAYLASKMACGVALLVFQLSHICIPDKDKYLKKITSSEAEIELYIASWLVEKMSLAQQSTPRKLM